MSGWGEDSCCRGSLAVRGRATVGVCPSAKPGAKTSRMRRAVVEDDDSRGSGCVLLVRLPCHQGSRMMTAIRCAIAKLP
jgi:hypothetical protein